MAARKTRRKKARRTTVAAATVDPGVRFKDGKLIITDKNIIASVKKSAGLNRGKQKVGKRVVSAIVTLSIRKGRREEGSDMSVDVRC